MKHFLRTLFAAGIISCTATDASAAVLTWTGAVNGFWSEPGNWSAGVAPQNGDSLTFPPSPAGLNSTNDMVSQHIHSISLSGGGYTLAGNNVLIDSDLTDSHSSNSTNEIFLSLYFTAAGSVNVVGAQQGSLLDFQGQVRMTVNQTLTFTINAFDGGGQPGYLTLHDAIVSSGPVVKRGSGPLYIRNRNPNICDRGMFFLEGTVYLLGLQVSVPSAPGFLVIGSNGVSQATVNVGANQWTGDLSITINDSEMYLNYNAQIGSLSMSGAAVVDGPGSFTIYGAIRGTSGNLTPTIQVPFSIFHDPTYFTTDGSGYAGLDVQAEISGPGGMLKAGSAALLLEQSNSFPGNIQISDGILDAHNPNALGTGTNMLLYGQGSVILRNMTVSGKTLQIQGREQITSDLSGSVLTTVGSCSWSGPVVLQTNLVVLGGDMMFTGPINGSGGLGFLNGTSIIGGSDGNTYTGITLARGSLLEFGKPSGVNAYAGPLVVGGLFGGPYEVRWLNSYQNVGATATLYANGIINLNNHNEDFGPVTFNGGEVDTGTGQFAIYAPLTVNPSSSSAVINGYLGLPPGADRVFIVGDGAMDCDLVVNAVVFGSPNAYFIKQGAGTMCLANANSYDAITLLEEGILDINTDAGLGTWPGLVIFNNATLRLSGSGNSTKGFEVVGAGVGGTHGAVEVVPNSSWTFSGNILLDAATTFNVGQSGGLGLNGVIYNNGPLIKTGTGGLVLGGGANNTYSGDTVVSAGALYLAKSPNRLSVPGNLVIGPGPAGPTTFARILQTGGLGGSTVTVNANSLFDLNGYNGILSQLNLNDGGSVQTGNGVLGFSSGGLVHVGSLSPQGSHVGSTLKGYVGITPNDLLTFSVNPYAIFYPFGTGPELDVTALILVNGPENPSLIPAGVSKEGLGRLRFGANNSYQGRTVVNGGTLQVDGVQPQSFVVVNSGAQLQGIGTVGHVYLNGSSAVLGPGASPGTLTCSNLDNGGGSGVLHVELNGTTAGSGYDQLNVQGSVTLSGITLSASLNYPSAVSDQFTIINNDGVDAVIGTFNNLPQGAKLYIGRERFQVSYTGGSGNDVVLTRLVTPPPPRLSLERVSTNLVRLLWPTNDPPFNLQVSSNLTAATWTPAAPAAVVIGTNNVVTNTASGSQQFYRLSNP